MESNEPKREPGRFEMYCPVCGAIAEAEHVHNGVGYVPVEPFHCYKCQWFEGGKMDELKAELDRLRNELKEAQEKISKSKSRQQYGEPFDAFCERMGNSAKAEEIIRLSTELKSTEQERDTLREQLEAARERIIQLDEQRGHAMVELGKLLLYPHPKELLKKIESLQQQPVTGAVWPSEEEIAAKDKRITALEKFAHDFIEHTKDGYEMDALIWALRNSAIIANRKL